MLRWASLCYFQMEGAAMMRFDGVTHASTFSFPNRLGVGGWKMVTCLVSMRVTRLVSLFQHPLCGYSHDPVTGRGKDTGVVVPA